MSEGLAHSLALISCSTNEWTVPFKCAVSTCPNTYTNAEICPTSYKFHNFPKNKEICNQWINKCDLEKAADVEKLKVCTEHFSHSDYVKVEGVVPQLKLHQYSVPHKNIVIENGSKPNTALINQFDALNSEIEELKLKIYKTNRMLLAKKHKLSVIKSKISHLMQKPNRELSTITKIFSATQINYLRGRKTFWSDDDLAMAFTLRHVGSKKLYLYLRNTLNMPLPALSCVQKWMAKRC
ncbi:unnamed protein product [Brassicogethes aeneus]|uniref:THAP-type domain-containing protein n=1 Tax=Brassicogethes aeneus TaxID=1431903 RepID=A0A9P0FG75_BRAAE|nr:unnamed protein product [Brassicogethes aeneus]